MTDIVGGSGLFDKFRQAVNEGITLLESEQSKINKATFDSMPMEQRDKFCQSLSNQGVKTDRIEKITGKSTSTVQRHVAGKHS